MTGVMVLSLPIIIFWFFIFWILGGIVFAVISILHGSRLKKVRFSCLFTLISAAYAYGAVYTGLTLGEENINSCLQKANGWLQSFSSIIACGAVSMVLSAIAWFLLLIVSGLVLMWFSQTRTKKWIDKSSDNSNNIAVKNESNSQKRAASSVG
ncbi:hypothetical protein D6827_00830 [Candidatus Parcubacteria bacterium]|nr:MAG: hypothetical protein D6827_00830 [Candidatus Parcubacteria bacterium]